jgi:hypothetical protein
MKGTTMKTLLAVIFIALVTVGAAYPATVELNFAWDRNTETDLAGYRLYFSATPGQYVKGTGSANLLKAVPALNPVSGSNHPNTVLQSMTGVDGQKVYFVLTAYDASQNESGFSNEVSYTFPDTTAPQAPKGFIVTLQRIIQALLDWFGGRLRIS